MRSIGIAFAIALCCATASHALDVRKEPEPAAVILLGGEPVRFDANFRIEFSDQQLRTTAAATRAGLVRWAATNHARELLAEMLRTHGRINAVEMLDHTGIGSAPEPGIATFAALADRSKLKTYTLLINPTPLNIPADMRPMGNVPATTADFMTLAWAAEMLHIQFYARGIRLPHHERNDFQEAWQALAAELQFPTVTHGDEDHGGRWRQARW
jgi:hypothetical protein